MELKTKITLTLAIFLFCFTISVCAEEPLLVQTSKSKEPLPSAIILPNPILENPHVRILILREATHFNLEIPSAYMIRIAPHLQAIEERDALKQVSVSANSNNIQIGDTVYSASHIKLVTHDHYFRVDGRDYREDLHIILSSDGKMNLVNEIRLEDYLKGVLPGEVSDKWNMEALKAQAVTARTYAYFKMLERKGDTHVLTADVLGQVYKGKAIERAKTTEAIETTHGEVMTFKDKSRENIFPAFFHASCGGGTTQADYVWRIQPNPVLINVPCVFCKGTKYDHWEASFSLKDIESKIRVYGYTISPITDITFSDYDPSGRARKVTILHKKGTLALDANDFRLFVGPEKLRSTKASVQVKNDHAYFAGIGWGHGVGFCQWGAKAQAETGKKYQEILQFYYPGSLLKKLYGPETDADKSSPAKKAEELFDKADRFMNEWFG